jgi:methylmalonyl-CoA mutase N-terminal domain/subunit
MTNAVEVTRKQDDLVRLLRSWIRPIEPPTEAATVSSSAALPLPLSYAPPTSERPGEYPYTRGRTARGYQERLWVMGQYSGFATPRETNARFKRLLEAGQTGLSIALDLPTQMGIDSDAPEAGGEVGKVGVPIDTVDDLILLLDGLPFEQIRQMRTSANAIGPVFAAFLLVALEELGADPKSFRLMLQNDPLKEFSARGTYIFPPAASVKLAVDVMEHFASHLDHWEPMEFCGYHIRDSGGTAIQEVAIATANGIAYLDSAAERGVDIRALAHTLFLFLSTSVDVFEESAKLRAARRIWARLLHERYQVPTESAGINVFVYTLGGALTAQEPLNNIVRVTLEALAAALGGAQTIATSSYDEALGLPSPEAAQLALRTQQVIAYESGVANVVDPLGGSYYLEDLTDRLEAEILREVAAIVDAGGAIAALESGSIQTALGDAAYRFQLEIERGDRPIVGVNIHASEPESFARTFKVPPELEAEQIESLRQIKLSRNSDAVTTCLDFVKRSAGTGANSIPGLIAAARERATVGETIDALIDIHGRMSTTHVRY